VAGEEISREELLAFTEANKEQAIALNQVFDLVEVNGSKIDEILKKLNNGLKSDIVSSIIGGGDEKTSLNAIKRDTASACSDAKMVKYFVGAVAIITVITTVLVSVILKTTTVAERQATKFQNTLLMEDTE